MLIVRGQANLLEPGAAADLERVRQLLDELEGKEEIVRLLDSARAGQGMKIFIGSENKLFALVRLVGDRRALSRPRRARWSAWSA